MQLRFAFALSLLVTVACGKSNADFAAEHGAFGKSLTAKLRGLPGIIEAAAQPADCSTAPALRWSRTGPSNVDFLDLATASDPLGRKKPSPFVYAPITVTVAHWLDDSSENFIGKKDGSVTDLVAAKVTEAKTIEYAVVARPGPADLESGQQTIQVYVVSLTGASVVCAFQFDAGADPKAATVRYDHVSVATGQVVNQHQVGFSDRLAASAGQAYQRAVKEKLGVRLER